MLKKRMNAAQYVVKMRKAWGLWSALRIADKTFGFSSSESIGFLNKYSFKYGSFVVYNPRTCVIERVG